MKCNLNEHVTTSSSEVSQIFPLLSKRAKPSRYKLNSWVVEEVVLENFDDTMSTHVSTSFFLHFTHNPTSKTTPCNYFSDKIMIYILRNCCCCCWCFRRCKVILISPLSLYCILLVVPSSVWHTPNMWAALEEEMKK